METLSGSGFFPLSAGTPMELLEAMARGGHERVIAVQDEHSGLRAWIALHHARRGPMYGGIRVWRYRDEEEAAMDALRLSRAMTLKCVLAGVPGGGAKTVVMADRLLDRPAAMAALGRHIESLGGSYRAGPDVGFTEADQHALLSETRWVAHHGDPLRPAGEATAEGAEWGLRAALSFLRGSDAMKGITVAVQGLGAVGFALARRLMRAGARVVGADPDPEAAERAAHEGVEVVDPGRIHEVEADVFAPCALGGTLHDVTIQRLSGKLVAGCANNVLARPEHASLLQRRGILYVPDFVMNSGALIEGAGFDRTGRTDWGAELRRIGETVGAVLQRARSEHCTTVDAALHMAQEILERERLALAPVEGGA